MPSILDALVIGGGPSGASTALLLAKAGWSVGVVEKANFPRHKVCGEFLSATSFPLLRQLGVAQSFFALAGPDVREVGIFSGEQVVTASMPNLPTAAGPAVGCGRALGRDHLDTLLLERAQANGASIWQPWSAVDVVRSRDEYVCTVVHRTSRQSRELRARLVVAAHGSWEPGPLPTQRSRPTSQPSDLFGFKAHFLDCRLPTDLMALLVFPGGYGGMVHSDHGRVSLSCCIRRDHLASVRASGGTSKAGEAVLAHIRTSCRAVDESLAGARLEHEWVSAGPIRPGIRQQATDGTFLVGNAAGEAHPVIAEGIGMAMQSAWQLCSRLTARPLAEQSRLSVDTTTRDYSVAWRRALGSRVRAGAWIAQWAMTPAAVSWALPVLRLVPGGLTMCARLSGKGASF